MRNFERYLVGLDTGASGAVCRVALGLCIPPVFRALSGPAHRSWVDLALFLALLIGVRLIPAVLRKLLPFSAEAKNIWSDRRQIAKLHDSYQWQKLFWVGVGLLLYAAVGGRLRTSETALTVICLIGGGAGLLIWRRINAAPPAPQIKASALHQS
ncbi:MAG: hypothetical protein K2X57_30315 [Xanthobacteraceae bacterium]|nr:hypothetical protein [Xanthobacteraceae bacterium]